MPIVDHSTVRTTPVRFAGHIDAATRAATVAAAVADVGSNMARALTACAAGDVAEFTRLLRFTTDAVVLAGRLGATDSAICEAIEAARAGGAE